MSNNWGKVHEETGQPDLNSKVSDGDSGVFSVCCVHVLEALPAPLHKDYGTCPLTATDKGCRSKNNVKKLCGFLSQRLKIQLRNTGNQFWLGDQSTPGTKLCTITKRSKLRPNVWTWLHSERLNISSNFMWEWSNVSEKDAAKLDFKIIWFKRETKKKNSSTFLSFGMNISAWLETEKVIISGTNVDLRWSQWICRDRLLWQQDKELG